jgi:cell division protein FtsW
MIALQVLVSVGVNLGVLPTKGLTLPLISSGGSSVLMTCAAIGVLVRISYEVSRAENRAEVREDRLADCRTAPVPEPLAGVRP